MRQEAVNTFSEGIMTDLNELATPEKVLTDALNATLTTYNGNEFALLNDVGNAKIGTSYLPTGYVPVGMKEYGGIIYVASWNPETKKGQIGCFPSPQHLYAGEDDKIGVVELDLTLFLKFKPLLSNNESNDLYIHSDFIRKPLFLIDGTSDYREFHPGDKFIIATTKIPEDIKTVIDAGVLVLKLAVVSNDGTISYVDDSTLNIYENGTWIYELGTTGLDAEGNLTKGKSIEEVLKDNNLILIYGGSKAGRMLLVAEYSVYSDFDVYWKHTLDSDGNIKTTFTGESIVSDGVEYTHVITSTSDSGETLSEPDTKTNTFVGILSHENNITDTYPVTSYINLEEGLNEVSVDKSAVYSYEIYPSSYFGIQGNLGMTGKINYPLLLQNNMLIGSWSLFVGDTNLVIDWQFDYFSIEDKEIKNITFTFYPIEIIASLPADTDFINFLNSNKENVYTLTLTKEHYSGSFTEHVAFNNKLVKNHIYVCRIDCIYTNGTPDILGFKYVYTSKFYNNVSTETLEYWSSINKDGTDNRPVVYIPIVVNTEYDIEKLAKEVVTTTKHYTYTEEITTVSSLDFGVELIIKAQPEEGESYIVSSLKEANYDVKLTTQVTYSDIITFNDRMFTLEDFAGNIKTDIINKYITGTSLDEEKVEKSITGEGLDELKDYIDSSSNITSTNNNTYTVSVYRGISAEVKDVSSVMLELERLSPIYEPDRVESGKLFNFDRDNTGKLTLLGGDEEGIWVGKVIGGDGSHIQSGTGPGGNGTHADYLNAIHSSGGGVVNLLCGVDGDDASFRIGPCDRDPNFRVNMDGSNSTFNPTINYAHYWDHDEVDDTENFIMVGWQDSLGDYTLINMGSRKNEKSSDLPTNYIRRLRIDNILICILSQLLIAKMQNVKMEFLAPRASDTLYHTNFNSKFIVSYTTTENPTDDIDFTFTKDKNTYPIEYCNNVWQDSLKKVGLPTIPNYLPKFKVKYPEDISQELSFGSDIDITRMVSVYVSAFSSTPNFGVNKYLTPEERSKIYRGKVTAIDKNGLCTLDGNYLEGFKLATSSDGSDKINELAFWVDDPYVYHARDTLYDGKQILWLEDDDPLTYTDYPITGKWSSNLEPWADLNVAENTEYPVKTIHLRGCRDDSGGWYSTHRRDINDMFITAAANDGITGNPIPSNYFNTIYVRGDIPTQGTTWVKRGDGSGPKIRTGVYFANVLKITLSRG